jgi:hypothetical protein
MAVVEKERIGVIQEFYDLDTGTVVETKNGKEFDFFIPKVQAMFKVSEEVIFITITTTRGRKIVKAILKK